MHVTLLGDSTLDNAAYTDGGPAVADHLGALLAGRGNADLLAVDGAMAADVQDQVRLASHDTTHVVLSVGGNDAMMQVDILTQPASRVWDALLALADVVDLFEQEYRGAVRAALALGRPTAVCTIYNGAFETASGEQRVVATALRIFNDAILQVALDHHLPVIDLRRVCSLRTDFANPIEPGVEGGRKIARAILTACDLDPSAAPFVIPSVRHVL